MEEMSSSIWECVVTILTQVVLLEYQLPALPMALHWSTGVPPSLQSSAASGAPAGNYLLSGWLVVCENDAEINPYQPCL